MATVVALHRAHTVSQVLTETDTEMVTALVVEEEETVDVLPVHTECQETETETAV